MCFGVRFWVLRGVWEVLVQEVDVRWIGEDCRDVDVEELSGRRRG